MTLSSPAAIPRRIVQIWGGGSPLSMLSKASAVNVQALNPGFAYDFYDDARIDAFIAQEFPQYAEVFANFRFPIQRYDFLRYLIIYRHGGFYFDLDLLLARGLEDLLTHGCVLPFERLTWAGYLRQRHGMDWEVGNYAFGAAAGHPFLAAVIQNCVAAQRDRRWTDAMLATVPWALRDEMFVIYSTGPGLVSRTLAEYRAPAHPVEVLFPADVTDPATWNRFGDHGVHLMDRNWRPRQNALQRRLVNFVGRRNESQAIARARKLGATRSLAPTFAPA